MYIKGIKICNNKFFSPLRIYVGSTISAASFPGRDSGNERSTCESVVLERICRILKFSTFRGKKLRSSEEKKKKEKHPIACGA